MRSGVRRCSVSEPPKSQAEAADQHQLEPLQCPRCNSTDTKFCYYNNYNLSQPRHFCRTCRRYWTVGGTLRNVPVGGATRRSATPPSSSPSSTLYGKRRRSSRPAARSSADAELVSAPAETQPAEQKAVFETMIMTEQEDAAPVDPDVAGTFEQVLAEPLPPGFLALGGDPFLQGHAACFGIDLGLGLEGFEDVGFGLGRAAPWNLPGAGDDAADGGFGMGMAGGVEEVWNISGGRGGVVGGDARGCFAWPDLAISTPSGKRM